MKAPAIFQGIQPGYLHLEPLELFTLLEPLGAHPAGSTVSRQTLEEHGFRIRLFSSSAMAGRAPRVFALVSRDEVPGGPCELPIPTC